VCSSRLPDPLRNLMRRGRGSHRPTWAVEFPTFKETEHDNRVYRIPGCTASPKPISLVDVCTKWFHVSTTTINRRPRQFREARGLYLPQTDEQYDANSGVVDWDMTE
jgi:hypothetical protein